jgi:hypothetical protein
MVLRPKSVGSFRLELILRRVPRALRGSHSNTNDIVSLYGITKSKGIGSRQTVFVEILGTSSNCQRMKGWDAGIRTPMRRSGACSTPLCRLDTASRRVLVTLCSVFQQSIGLRLANIGARCPKKVNFWLPGDNLWLLLIVFTVEATQQVVTGPTGLEGKKCNLSQVAPPLLALAASHSYLFPVRLLCRRNNRRNGGSPYGGFPWFWRSSLEVSYSI